MISQSLRSRYSINAYGVNEHSWQDGIITTKDNLVTPGYSCSQEWTMECQRQECELHLNYSPCTFSCVSPSFLHYKELQRRRGAAPKKHIMENLQFLSGQFSCVKYIHSVGKWGLPLFKSNSGDLNKCIHFQEWNVVGEMAIGQLSKVYIQFSKNLLKSTVFII